MEHEFRTHRELSKAVCEKIQPIIDPLSQLFEIHTFGYRKFFSDGNSFGISNNFPLAVFCQEHFDRKIIPSYENEVRAALKEEQFHFFRRGEPDRNNIYLSALYDLDIWNTLSFYRNNGDSVEGFYFASTRDNDGIIEQYINNISLFERFSFYFKDKFSDVMSSEELKSATAFTLSPEVFKNNPSLSTQDTSSIKKFIKNTPIQRFFLNVNGTECRLSLQEFKCLALLSRGKTSKEIGSLLNISSRTVESYIENIKCKSKVNCRNHLIDLFLQNYDKSSDLLNYLEKQHKET